MARVWIGPEDEPLHPVTDTDDRPAPDGAEPDETTPDPAEGR